MKETMQLVKCPNVRSKKKEKARIFAIIIASSTFIINSLKGSDSEVISKIKESMNTLRCLEESLISK